MNDSTIVESTIVESTDVPLEAAARDRKADLLTLTRYFLGNVPWIIAMIVIGNLMHSIAAVLVGALLQFAFGRLDLRLTMQSMKSTVKKDGLYPDSVLQLITDMYLCGVGVVASLIIVFFWTTPWQCAAMCLVIPALLLWAWNSPIEPLIKGFIAGVNEAIAEDKAKKEKAGDSAMLS